MDFENPWTLDSELKKGQSLQIAQAWKKHEDDRRRISKSPREILEVMTSEHFEEMESFMNEVFLSTVDLDFGCGKDYGGGVFLSEVFTNTQRVMKEAGKRGHRVGTPISLETGFDLRRPLDQKAALKIVDKEEPYCLVIAFPCGPFSPLQHLNPNTDPEKRQQKLEEGRSLLRFAVKLARRQRKAGRHFILENLIHYPQRLGVNLSCEPWWRSWTATLQSWINAVLAFDLFVDSLTRSLQGWLLRALQLLKDFMTVVVCDNMFMILFWEEAR